MREVNRLSRDGKPVVRQARIEITVTGPGAVNEYKSRTVLVDRDESASSILNDLIGELSKP